MSLNKPYKRTVRQLTDGSYSMSGHWRYLLHPEFAQDPQHYIRAFLLIQEDVIELFKYVEPSNQNLDTVSLKIHSLLTRICIEVEANFTAILRENNYRNRNNWSLDKDYKLIQFSHKLSDYTIKFPTWKGSKKHRTPFENWKDTSQENWHVLNWYRAYNKSKHDRHSNFELATFDNMLEAFAGLSALLSAQFMTENYSPNTKSKGLSGPYSYDFDRKYETGIGDYLHIKFPDNWIDDERYGFNWSDLENDSNPFITIDFNEIKRNCT